MRWTKEKEKIAEELESWLDCTSQEINFVEELLKVLNTSSSKAEFKEAAQRNLKVCSNPWIIEELSALVDAVV
jgi:L-lysine 2,3-aminomutase